MVVIVTSPCTGPRCVLAAAALFMHMEGAIASHHLLPIYIPRNSRTGNDSEERHVPSTSASHDESAGWEDEEGESFKLPAEHSAIAVP